MAHELQKYKEGIRKANIIYGRLGMGRLFFIALCLFLTGCGSEYVAPGDSSPSASSGIHVDKTYFDLLEQEFVKTAECAGLNGNFWDVAIFLMPPPSFACAGDNLQGKICYGEFIRPNKIFLADRFSWRHEVLHYLLYKNIGDLDPGHQSELFGKCSREGG